MIHIKRFIVNMTKILCSIIDHIPAIRYYEGRWHINPSCWGCYPLRLATLAMKMDEKWDTEVWK